MDTQKFTFLNVELSAKESGDDTARIQRAADDCFRAGGGTVTLDAGVFRVGGIRLRSNTTLFLKSGACLLGSRDPEAYDIVERDTLEPLAANERTEAIWEPRRTRRNNDFSRVAGSRWNRALIRILHAENVRILGEARAVIDGANCYDAAGEEHYRGPHGIGARYVKGLVLSGYTVRNTGNWAHLIYHAEDVLCEDITVEGGHDGVHFGTADRVTVKNCRFYCGDDCVAGFDIRRLTLTDSVLNSACSGMRLGGTDLHIKNCRFFGPGRYTFRGALPIEDKIAGTASPAAGRTNMLSVFTYYCDDSLDVREPPGNILIENCTCDHVDRFLHYNFSGNEQWQAVHPLADLTVRDVTATEIGQSLLAYGTEEVPFRLTVERSSFSFSGAPREFVRAAHFAKIHLSDVEITGVSDTLLRLWSDAGETDFQNVRGVPTTLIHADAPFSCKSI